MQIDIEGSEYELLSSLHEKDVALPRQLAIEFHLQDFGLWVTGRLLHRIALLNPCLDRP
jgi:hypothetical protein